MTSKPSTDAVLGALFASKAMGLCVFDAAGVVLSTEGAASAWAPPAGHSIEEAAVFTGLSQAFADVRAGNHPLSISGVALGGADAVPIDLDIIWLETPGCFAALSKSAAERVSSHREAAQIVRDNRLLEEKVRQQQAKIAEQTEMLTLFVRHVPAAVAMLDRGLGIVMASERWKEEHGDPAEALPGAETASPLTWPGVAERLQMAVDGGVPSTRIEKSTARGRPIWKRLAQAPWRGPGRRIGGAILFCEDVTDTMRKAESLRARVEDLHKLSAEMDNLGKAVADDLRAPLRQIDFFSRFLLDSKISTEDWASRDYLIQIRLCVERVDRMMAALDRYMRLSERDIMPARFDIAEAVMTAVAEQREMLSAAGVTVRIRDTLSVEGDLTMVSGLFRRLIDNSLKYAGGGSTIVVDCFEEADGVLTRLSDDGPGIPAHLRRRAFNFFERLDAPATVQGEGMGLAECRKIADLHGGAMTLDPDFDAGLRALISLPARARRPAARLSPPSQ